MFNLIGWKAVYSTLTAIVLLVGGLIVSYEKTPPADYVVGAIPGNSVDGNEFVVGGVTHYSFHQTMVGSSTSACSIRTPNATTTFVAANMATRITTTNLANATVKRIGIAIGGNTSASTTELGFLNFGAGQNGELTVTATTTGRTNDRDGGKVVSVGSANLVPPNSYINFYTEGTSTPTVIGLAGVCNAYLIGVK